MLSSAELGSGLDIYGNLRIGKIDNKKPGTYECSLPDATDNDGVLMDVAKESLIKLDTDWLDVNEYNYQSIINYTQEDFEARKSIEICANLCDANLFLQDTCIERAHVIDAENILNAEYDAIINNDSGFIFSADEDTWLRIRLKKKQ